MRVHLAGRVQGLGVRPAVARLARELGLAGSVRNSIRGLEIDIQGQTQAVEEFQARLASALPAACQVFQREVQFLEPMAVRGFSIEREPADGALAAVVPPDTALCADCLEESRDPRNRRGGYALISCAACGPRYSVIRHMPYERDDTTLAEFPLCCSCRREYTTPEDRRFHAQTTACAECGPVVWGINTRGQNLGMGREAVSAAVATLRAGEIIALRGVGGYQLLCDAASEPAVARLRARKQRATKPLAVLVASLVEAAALTELDECARRILTDPANPIVLCPRRGAAGLAPSVHPGLHTVGVLLPTTALHDQLAREFGGPLVCTSGNREGDPLESEPNAAERRLAGIADLWLHHNRPIARPIDDSVVRIMAGRAVTIRLARGWAPLVLDVPAGPPLLALGGHQKAAVAWCNGVQCALGPHVGDLETIAARERFREHCRQIQELYRFAPAGCVHDLHPDYFTTPAAKQWGVPSRAVQHHQAHMAAAMLEHGLLDRPVLGIACDGTGLGTDGALWGGECFAVRGVGAMERVAHLRPLMLPGGEATIREPWRAAVSVLAEAIGREELLRRGACGVESSRVERLLEVLARPRLCLRSTSVGRLFDAAAAVILSIHVAQFEGEPAMRLEAVADPAAPGWYPLPLTADSPAQLDWRPLVAALWRDQAAGVEPGVMAMRFHRGLAVGIAAVMRRYPGWPVVLGGGVFQNRLLTELLVEELDGASRLHLPGRIPPNDGGLAAGQLVVALLSPRDDGSGR
jgi:hydrogenase maturation protein HypF